MKLLISLLICASALCAQTVPPPGVLLTWADPGNPTNTTYSIWRATGLCSGTPTFAKIAAGVTAKTYDDLTAIGGNYAYVITATAPGLPESAQSSCIAATVLSRTPQSVNAVGH